MKRLLVAALFALPVYAHAGGRWVEEPDVQRPALRETTHAIPFVFTDTRYCTQYLIYTLDGPYQGGVAMIPRLDQNGKPAIALRCTPTNPAPEPNK